MDFLIIYFTLSYYHKWCRELYEDYQMHLGVAVKFDYYFIPHMKERMVTSYHDMRNINNGTETGAMIG